MELNIQGAIAAESVENAEREGVHIDRVNWIYRMGEGLSGIM